MAARATVEYRRTGITEYPGDGPRVGPARVGNYPAGLGVATHDHTERGKHGASWATSRAESARSRGRALWLCLVVALRYLGERDLEAVGELEHDAEGEVDLSTLARAHVVAVQPGAERKLLLREVAGDSQLSKCPSEDDMLGRLGGCHPPNLAAQTTIRLPHIYGTSLGTSTRRCRARAVSDQEGGGITGQINSSMRTTHHKQKGGVGAITSLLRCAVAVGLLSLAGCGAGSGCPASGAPGCDELAHARLSPPPRYPMQLPSSVANSSVSVTTSHDGTYAVDFQSAGQGEALALMASYGRLPYNDLITEIDHAVSTQSPVSQRHIDGKTLAVSPATLQTPACGKRTATHTMQVHISALSQSLALTQLASMVHSAKSSAPDLAPLLFHG